MKSVTGEIVSSTPASLSRAASILSNFVKADNGASQAVKAYLQRTDSAFNELVRLHSKPDRRARENHRSDAAEPSAPTTSVTAVDELTRRVQQSKETAQPESNSDEQHKRKKKKKKKEDEVEVEEEQRKGEANVKEEELSHKKKTKTKKSDLGTSGDDEKKKGVEVKGEESNGEAHFGDLGSEGDKQKKKKKKHKSKSREVENGDIDGYKENGGGIGEQEGVSGKERIKEEEQKSDGLMQKEENRKKRINEDEQKSDGLKQKEENRKKRKSGEIEEERRDNSQSEERPRKKKR